MNLTFERKFVMEIYTPIMSYRAPKRILLGHLGNLTCTSKFNIKVDKKDMVRPRNIVI